MTRKEELTKVIEEIENEKNTTSLMPEAECYNHGLDVAIQIIKKHLGEVEE